MNTVPLNDISARIIDNRRKIDAAFSRVLDSGWLVLGSEVERFERTFASYVGAQFGVGVANGTDAIELALKAVGVSEKDRVATVANAGGYSTTAILAIGATPWFMDIEKTTQLVTIEEVSNAVQNGVKAVVVTHLFGRVIPEIEQIRSLCLENDTYLVEDCAQAHGARIQEGSAGSFGHLGCFSFYPTKNLGALGDGGAIVTSDEAIAERLKLLRQYGWEGKYHICSPGARNSRLDEVQAAILFEFLPQLDKSNSRRREIANRYSSEVTHGKIFTPDTAAEEYVAHLYVIRCPMRDSLQKYLKENGVGCDIHYPVPDHRQPMFGDRFSHLQLETTEALSGEILTIPCYPEMTADQVSYVIAKLNQWKP